MFFENWSTHSDQFKVRRKEDLLVSIAEGLLSYPDIDIETVTRSIFKVLKNKISAGELEKVIAVIPTNIRELFK